MNIIKKSLYYINLLFFAGLIFASCVRSETNFPIGIVTGSKTGTYFRFGQEIADKARMSGLSIIVRESKGTIANIERLSEKTPLAMVQSDILALLKSSDKSEIKRIARNLRLMFPLYNEEVHLFANKKITSFEDLEGKRVIFGVRNSGNWLTSHNLFYITGIKPGEEILDLDPPEALQAVLQGTADAMIYVVGKPARLFSKVESEHPYLIEKFHFVPLNHPKIIEKQVYVHSNINSDDYSWFKGDVPTIAVKAVLICYDFSSRDNDYYRIRCDQLSQLAKIIRNNIDKLKQTGHPKWKEINLNEKIEIWESDSCSK